MELFRTERLILRTFEVEDIDSFMIYRNNEEWMKYQSFKGKTKQEYIDSIVVDYDIEKGSQLAIILRETGFVIGDIYIKKEQEKIYIGYTISPAYARKGYATEMVVKLLSYLTELYPGHTILCETDIENEASKNFLIKLGFRKISTNEDGLTYKYIEK